ncbi:MAG: hypothetical protein CMN76_04475 [Spirochaetaceae bacterium]|nr:hypothetical protein [Spirochaetaceae bacterium]
MQSILNFPDHEMKFILPNRPGLLLVLAACVTIWTSGAVANPYSQGRLAFARGDFDSAMKLLEQSTRSDPSNGNAHFYIGLIHERKGRKPESIQAYKQAVARRMEPDLREKALWKIVLYSKYVGDWGAVSVYSSQFLKYKHHPEMARLQSMAANQGGSSSAEMVRLVQKGQKAEKAGSLTEAIGYYEEALDIEPEAHSVRWNLANVAMKVNQYSRAVKHLQYLDRKDSQWKYNYKLGVCYYQLGRYQNALSSFQEATEQNKRPSGSFRFFIQVGRGLTYLELEDLKSAEAQLNGAARTKKSALVNGALARLALMKGERGLATERYRAALDEDPEQLDALSVQALLTSNPTTYEKFQDQLYKSTVYQPAYYNAVTLQYVHVLVARSRFDQARTVLESLDQSELERIHSMKQDVATLSGRAFIFAATGLEQGEKPSPRTALLEEEIQMLLNFHKSDRANAAIQKLKEQMTEAAVDPQRPATIPESPAGWLRSYPQELEPIARLELVEELLRQNNASRAFAIARYWSQKSEPFKKAGAESGEIKKMTGQNDSWARLFHEPGPEGLSPGANENSSTEIPAGEQSTTDTTIPEKPARPETTDVPDDPQQESPGVEAPPTDTKDSSGSEKDGASDEDTN